MKSGWRAEKLGEVCSFLKRGISPKYLDSGGVCVINQKCIRNHCVSYESSRRHDSIQKAVSSERFIKLGDVLVNSTGTGTLGRVAQVRESPSEPTTVDSHVTIVRPMQDKFYPDFFGYMLILIEEEIQSSGEGCGGQIELARSDLAEKFVVSYPTSQEEQQRIVAILDEAFDSIAAARANAEQNFKNARELFESHLQSVFMARGEGWVVSPLGELAQFKNGLNYNRNSNGQTLPIVGVANFQENYFTPLSELDLVTIDGELADNYAIQKNDILTVRSNGSKHLVGRCMLVDELEGLVSYSGFVIRIRFDAKNIFPKFLLHFMKCKATRKILTSGGGGANITNINQDKLSTLPVPLPAYEIQVELASRLDEAHEEIQRLESLYKQKITALDELKKALLHKAFSGDL